MNKNIQRRKFGKTNLYISELSFGAMNIRQLDTPDEAYEILNYALDQGINLIDTARGYNKVKENGILMESEYLTGQAVKNRTDLNEPIVVVTKGHAYTIPELEKELTTSLDKLGISGKNNLKIGNNEIKLVYLIHGINEKRWTTAKQSGALERLIQFKNEGLVNYIGFSSHYKCDKEIKEAIDTGIFDVAELPYNVFNRSLGEDGELNLIEYAYNKGMGIINMKAFGGNGTASVYNILRDYISIDYPSMLKFCLSSPYITTVDAGAKYIYQFKDDINTTLDKKRLSNEEKIKLKYEADKVSGYMKNICRECMHCLEKFECPQGIDFPGILSIYSRYTISKNLGRDTSQYFKQYKKFSPNAADCIACGKCNPWCEYKLDIPEKLKEAHKTLSGQ